ncbi:MAG: hypothetical protein ACM31L_06520 [Actinomycetota bacterium]
MTSIKGQKRPLAGIILLRLCVVVLLGGLASGCAVIPPAVTLAKMAGDGMLMAGTGKSSTDYGLSFATGQDCATMRVFEGEDICRPEENAAAPQAPVQVAAAPSVDYVAAYADDTPAPPLLAAPPPPRPVVVAQAKRPAAKVASLAKTRHALAKSNKRVAQHHPPRRHKVTVASAAPHPTVPHKVQAPPPAVASAPAALPSAPPRPAAQGWRAWIAWAQP